MRISDWSSDVCSSDLRHPAVDDVNAAIVLGRIEAAQIFPGEPREILCVGQLPREETAVLFNADHRVRAEAPLLRFVQPRDLAGDRVPARFLVAPALERCAVALDSVARSEEHTSELQSLMRISYAVFF